jgi:hypothetical protein
MYSANAVPASHMLSANRPCLGDCPTACNTTANCFNTAAPLHKVAIKFETGNPETRAVVHEDEALVCGWGDRFVMGGDVAECLAAAVEKDRFHFFGARAGLNSNSRYKFPSSSLILQRTFILVG